MNAAWKAATDGAAVARINAADAFVVVAATRRMSPPLCCKRRLAVDAAEMSTLDAEKAPGDEAALSVAATAVCASLT